MAADITLTLGVPSGDQTMDPTPGNVRRVVLPLGTRAYTITSESAFYIEEDPAQAKADATASDASKRQKFAAGTYSLIPFLSGRGAQALLGPRYLYFVGTVATQPFWITASPERGS